MPNLRRIKSSSTLSVPGPTGAGASTPSEDLRAEPLLCLPELLHGFGTSFGAIAQRTGLPPTILDDAGGRIDFAHACRLLAECAAVTGCAHFGLLVGEHAGAAAVGPIGDLARHSASVGDALRALSMHLHLRHRAGVLGLRPRGPLDVELAYLMHHPGTPGARHVAEGALVIAMHVLRRLCGPHWSAIEATFACDRPQDTGPYRDRFGAAVRFNASRFAIGFRASWLDWPIPGADPAEHRRLASLVSDMEHSRPYPVRMLVATAPSVDAVSQVLGLSPRTLNRRLAAEGTTFKALLEDTRCRLARQLLEDTRMPAIEIAAALHYTTPSAFSRAFSHWNGGTNPRRVRAAASEARSTGQRSRG
jgi:AraC-like DNA-binding protein